MFRIRFKMSPTQQQHQSSSVQQHRNKEWVCCFGLHVQSATIIIGLWHLFLNILALSLLAIMWRNPHMMEELENSYDYSVDLTAPALPTPLSKVEPPYAYRDHSLNYRKHAQSFDMGGLVCTCMIAITLMMIYGTIRGKPGHLLPFLCLQLFDFAITTLTAAGYLCYLQAIHRLVAQSYRLPWREELLQLSPEQLVVVVLIVFICIVFLKAYAIGIIWRCYKYLTLQQQSMRPFLPCVISDLQPVNEERAYSTLLPNYDEAIAQFMKQAPPPSYQVAMSNCNADNDSIQSESNQQQQQHQQYHYDLNHHPNEANIIDIGPIVNIETNNDNNNDAPNNNNTMHVNNNSNNNINNNQNDDDNNDNLASSGIEYTRENDSGVVSYNDIIVEHDGMAAGATTPPPTYDSAIIMAIQAERAAAQTAISEVEEAEAEAAAAAAARRFNNESQA